MFGAKFDFNLYAYGYDDPINRTDPSGKFAFLIPLGVACVESGACEAAAIWAARTLGTLAAGAIIEHAYNESHDKPPTPAGFEAPCDPELIICQAPLEELFKRRRIDPSVESPRKRSEVLLYFG